LTALDHFHGLKTPPPWTDYTNCCRSTGTSSIVDEVNHEPLLSNLSVIVETAVRLQRDGHKVVIVSSGAIGMALRQMNLDKRPKHLGQVQALAAIGQCRLIALWDDLFDRLRQSVAQVLLTRNDVADWTQYQNAQHTFRELMNMNVIPIVNENDTLAVQEIKFGDNDTLSAITAGLVQADYLFLMTDVDCLYDKNPRTNPDAKPIEVVEDIDALEADVSSKGSSLGTGGMYTKLVAARIATSAGVTTVITRSSQPGNIRSIIEYAQAKSAAAETAPTKLQPAATQQLPSSAVDVSSTSGSEPPMNQNGIAEPETKEPIPSAPLHTRFLPSTHPIADRRFRLLHVFAPSGSLYVDENAYGALQRTANLFPSGVVDVEGTFHQQETVKIFVVKRLPATSSSSQVLPTSPSSSTPNGAMSILSPRYETLSPSPPGYETSPPPVEVGRAVVTYSSWEIRCIMGCQSSEIRGKLGYAESSYIAVRDNIALFPRAESKSRPSTPVADALRS
jgi:glutamate 5-kinase